MQTRFPARGPFPVLASSDPPLVDTAGLDTGLLALQGLGITFLGTVVAVLITWWLVWVAVLVGIGITWARNRGRPRTLTVDDSGLRLGLHRWSFDDLSAVELRTTRWLEDHEGREVPRDESGILLVSPERADALWMAPDDARQLLAQVHRRSPTLSTEPSG